MSAYIEIDTRINNLEKRIKQLECDHPQKSRYENVKGEVLCGLCEKIFSTKEERDAESI